jgi:hypothetical protein
MLSSLPLAGREPMTADAAKRARTRERHLRQLAEAMAACEQTAGVSVADHGRAVAAHFVDLLDVLNGRTAQIDWVLPTWVTEHRGRILAELHTDDGYIDDIVRYLTVHDCGKPFCVTTDDDGRRHFPDHANVSADRWRDVNGLGDDDRVVTLIRRDMDIHLLTGDDTDMFADGDHAAALLLAGLAEIHANAAMFGGVSSTSFKMKWKKLDRRGRRICARRYS